MATPAWTDRNDSDPGITLLTLLAYVLIGLVFAALVVAYVVRRRRGRRWRRARVS